METRIQLLESIATTISDYRVGELNRPTPEHVEQWVNQFPENVQVGILTELGHVLKKTYFSKKEVQDFIHVLILNPEITSNKPNSFWKGVSFLSIQGAGNSQREMLEMFDEVLMSECKFNLDACGKEPKSYLYLDDAIFTGNRIKNDLINWIENQAPLKATLNVVTVAFHRGGQWYAKQKIEEAAKAAGKEINITWWRCIEIEDRKRYINQSDVLRPIILPNDELAQQYANNLQYQVYLRKPGNTGENAFFSSEAGRHLLEQEFLKAGVKIRSMCPYLNDYQRPLGNMILETLGFGSLLVTYRNCPNNSPLALWAGDPWYPLFPRKAN